MVGRMLELSGGILVLTGTGVAELIVFWFLQQRSGGDHWSLMPASSIHAALLPLAVLSVVFGMAAVVRGRTAVRAERVEPVRRTAVLAGFGSLAMALAFLMVEPVPFPSDLWDRASFVGLSSLHLLAIGGVVKIGGWLAGRRERSGARAWVLAAGFAPGVLALTYVSSYVPTVFALLGTACAVAAGLGAHRLRPAGPTVLQLGWLGLGAVMLLGLGPALPWAATWSNALTIDGTATDASGALHPELIELPPGTFTMGSADLPNAGPHHPVQISGFQLCRTEVTQAQWAMVLGESPQIAAWDADQTFRFRMCRG